MAAGTTPVPGGSSPAWQAPPANPTLVSRPWRRLGGLLLVAASGIIVVGTYLPWIVVQALGCCTEWGLPYWFTQSTFSGFDRSGVPVDGSLHGVFLFLLSMLLALCGMLLLFPTAKAGPVQVAALICGVVLGGLVYLDFEDIAASLATMHPGSSDYIVSIGPGFWLVALAVPLAIIGAIVPIGAGRGAAPGGSRSAEDGVVGWNAAAPSRRVSPLSAIGISAAVCLAVAVSIVAYALLFLSR